jgi:putrescine transport system substrate-binding protein
VNRTARAGFPATTPVPRSLFALVMVLALAACGGRQPPATAAPHELNVFTWSDFLAPDVLADFQKETGVKVNLVTFPSQEVLEATLLTGRTDYDVAVVASSELSRLVGARVLRELDRSQLPNWGNLDAEVTARLATEDPGNRFAAAYDWGTTAIAYDVDKIRKLAPGAPVDSWRLVLDPAVVSKYAGCGVSVLDAPSEIVAVALIADGQDPNTTDVAKIEAAARRLMAIRPYVRKIDGDMQIADLASGDICLMVTWTSNFVLGRRRAVEAGRPDRFRYMIPREGTISWVDAFAIPADAPHPQPAHAFINYMMRADIAARSANFVGNVTVNAAALSQIEPLLRDDPSIYPSAEIRQTLQPLHSRPEATNRVVTRVWTQFRSGH